MKAMFRRWSRITSRDSQIGMISNLLPIVICWEIWLERNQRKYELKFHDANFVILKIRRWIRELNAIIAPKKMNSASLNYILGRFGVANKQIRRTPPIVVSWEKPLAGFVALNTDGSLSSFPFLF